MHIIRESEIHKLIDLLFFEDKKGVALNFEQT